MNTIPLLMNLALLQEAATPEPTPASTDFAVVFVVLVMLIIGFVIITLVVGLVWLSRRKRNEPQALFDDQIKDQPEPVSPSRGIPVGVGSVRRPHIVRPGPATPAIFISYRREDSSDVTGRIYDRLCQHFGEQNVFKDVDSIPLGVDFREHLENSVAQCDVLLTIIGRQWMAGEKGKRRLDDARDFVRIEMAAALKRNIPVVPVLVQGSSIPNVEDLPEQLQSLAYRHGTPVRPDPDFHQDMDRLIKGIEGYLKKQ